MRRIALYCVSFFTLVWVSMACGQGIDNSKFNRILTHAVNQQGLVDYTGTIKNRDLLDSYLVDMRKVDPKSLPQAEALAYWINLYNATVIQSVIDHWPVKSVLNDFPGNAFFEKTKHPTPLGELTLNQIETDVIRKQFKEPRVHFALNCASKGCPKLRAQAYTGANLVKELDEGAASFANDVSKNRFDIKGGRAGISQIFKWYADDFQIPGGPLAFLARYSQSTEREKIPELKVEYLDYDWNLNGQ